MVVFFAEALLALEPTAGIQKKLAIRTKIIKRIVLYEETDTSTVAIALREVQQ